MAIHWGDYPIQGIHDELIDRTGCPRPGAEALCTYLASLGEEALSERVGAAEQLIGLMGIVCPSSGDLRSLEWFRIGGSGPSGGEVKGLWRGAASAGG